MPESTKQSNTKPLKTSWKASNKASKQTPKGDTKLSPFFYGFTFAIGSSLKTSDKPQKCPNSISSWIAGFSNCCKSGGRLIKNLFNIILIIGHLQGFWNEEQACKCPIICIMTKHEFCLNKLIQIQGLSVINRTLAFPKPNLWNACWFLLAWY